MLGTHVEQKGSMVAPDRLRFDISHFAKVTPEELAQVEAEVKDLVRADLPLQELRDTPVTVSYTHLTLPTSDLV